MKPTGWKNDDGIVVTLNENDEQGHFVQIVQKPDKLWVTDLQGLIDALMAANAELELDTPPSVMEMINVAVEMEKEE